MSGVRHFPTLEKLAAAGAETGGDTAADVLATQEGSVREESSFSMDDFEILTLAMPRMTSIRAPSAASKTNTSVRHS